MYVVKFSQVLGLDPSGKEHGRRGVGGNDCRCVPAGNLARLSIPSSAFVGILSWSFWRLSGLQTTGKLAKSSHLIKQLKSHCLCIVF